jgi:hypothetical protein
MTFHVMPLQQWVNVDDSAFRYGSATRKRGHANPILTISKCDNDRLLARSVFDGSLGDRRHFDAVAELCRYVSGYVNELRDRSLRLRAVEYVCCDH